jgi:hypothetical protein
MNKEEKELTHKAVQKRNKNICPKCDSFLHAIPGGLKQDFCYTCGIHWTLQELEDYCMIEIDKLNMKRQAEMPFIAWCYDKFKQGVINEINQ